jgi:hypothetical protein
MQYGDEDDNADLGLSAEEEPSPTAYESETAAPMREDTREEVQGRLKGRAVWESANENGDPTGNEVENGPDVDPNDPNLSATFAEAGAEDRKQAMGMRDTEPFLDDPEQMDDEDS